MVKILKRALLIHIMEYTPINHVELIQGPCTTGVHLHIVPAVFRVQTGITAKLQSFVTNGCDI